jgi:ABC-type branched-subunit amino acid transport system substrate-binding protein
MQLKRLLAAVAAVCALGTLPAAAQDIKIGANLPMSGPNAEYGDLFAAAAGIAVEHINADKMLSKKLTLVVEDSQATPQQGVVAMNKLVNVEKVPYVLSAFTGVSKAIAPVGDKAKVVSVNGGGIGPDLAELGDYFWNVIPLVNLEVQAFAPYLIKDRGWKKVALVYVDDPAGEAIKKELDVHVPKNGGSMAVALQVPRASQQFSGIAAKVREASPDVVFIASFGAQQAQIVKQLRDNGVKQQIVSYSAFSAPTVMQLPEAKGALYPTQSVNWGADPVSQRLARDWKAKKGKEPTAYVANYYNAVLVFAKLAQALEKAGKPITGENLLAQRKAMGSFDVAGGKMQFLPNGTVSMPLSIYEIDGGSGKLVKADLVAR